MDHSRSTTIEEIFTAEVVAAGETAYSRIFDVAKLAGNASLQITMTGDGTGQFEWIGTLDEDAVVAEFIKVNNANDIVTAFTKTSGPGSDGKHVYPFSVSLVKRLAIKVTETSTSDPITVTAIIALQ
jgi:hypothetical protein